MGKRWLASALVLALLVAAAVHLQAHEEELQSTTESKQVYVVHLRKDGNVDRNIPEAHTLAAERHANLLTLVHSSYDAAMECRLYSYRNVFDGFSATLTSQQAATLADLPEVATVFPAGVARLMTTRSWDFLGLSSERNASGLSKESQFGRDVIVGVFDSGIWPESSSFSDESLTPVPSRWKGICVDGQNFTASKHCNRKIIGARYYFKGFLAANQTFEKNGFLSARDADGHGTHVASTIAGRYVEDVSLFGLAKGAVRGAAPLARLAIYKVCWPGCYIADILAAFDDAIEDGVDVLSLSLGYAPPEPEYFQDPIAIGVYYAMKYGILSICAAGNEGPNPSSVVNGPPWSLTVGASSIDRTFSTNIALGNSETFLGSNVLNQPNNMDNWYPLIYAEDAFNDKKNIQNASQCFLDSLDTNKVKGKIILCETHIDYNFFDKIRAVTQAKAVGMIVIGVFNDDQTVALPLPVALVNGATGKRIKTYINSTKEPSAKIGPTFTKLSEEYKAPAVASFSGRGPNLKSPEIIKPDIVAPGISILAAWSPVAPLNEITSDTRRFGYYVQSGTSMATPHASGLATLIKSVHPTWSPAAIKSAIMTTATRLDNSEWPITDNALPGSFATPFALGAGEINPTRAAHPGLIFDISPDDYLLFLCASGYNSTTIKVFAEDTYKCPTSYPDTKDLNYPTIHFNRGLSIGPHNTVSRTVTNVGDKNSTYRAIVVSPIGVQIKVSPNELKFSKLDQKLNFNVSIEPRVASNVQQTWSGPSTGAVVWVDLEKKYYVNMVVLVSP